MIVFCILVGGWFSREWIANVKGDSLDIFWLKDKGSVDTANLPAQRFWHSLQCLLARLHPYLVHQFGGR